MMLSARATYQHGFAKFIACFAAHGSCIAMIFHDRFGAQDGHYGIIASPPLLPFIHGRQSELRVLDDYIMLADMTCFSSSISVAILESPPRALCAIPPPSPGASGITAFRQRDAILRAYFLSTFTGRLDAAPLKHQRHGVRFRRR